MSLEVWRKLPWRLLHRAIVCAGAGAPTLYLAWLGVIAQAAQSDAVAKTTTHSQIAMLAALAGSPRAVAFFIVLILIWVAFVWQAELLATRQERGLISIISLGQRAEDCAQGVVQLVAMYKQREDMLMRYRWQSGIDRDYIFGSSSLMGEFSLLYQAQAIAIFREARNLNLHVECDPDLAEHPTNPLGVEEVGRELGVLAERIKHQ